MFYYAMAAGRRVSRRFFLSAIAGLLGPAAVWADMTCLEPEWIKTRHLQIGQGPLKHRLVHFTDIHHKGDAKYLEGAVRKINSLSPDAVCFTGDLIEDAKFLPEALQILEKIKSPLFGVPGNHDYWSHADFNLIAKSFARTGGAWLVDQQARTAGGNICLTGMACLGGTLSRLAPQKGCKTVLLLHFPLLSEQVKTPYDLMLAGHSHGGQVRIPFYGAVVLPYWVGRYQVGMFHLPGGPLYVNPGLGWLVTPVRFNCRPELTVFDE
jgi:predicted MPP superfamily phosphohydrolase